MTPFSWFKGFFGFFVGLLGVFLGVNRCLLVLFGRFHTGSREKCTIRKTDLLRMAASSRPAIAGASSAGSEEWRGRCDASSGDILSRLPELSFKARHASFQSFAPSLSLRSRWISCRILVRQYWTDTGWWRLRFVCRCIKLSQPLPALVGNNRVYRGWGC